MANLLSFSQERLINMLCVQFLHVSKFVPVSFHTLSHVLLAFCFFPSHLPSAPPQVSAPHPVHGDHPKDGEEKGVQAGGGVENGTEEGQSDPCCKVKTPRWIQACMHYRFPASIDPFTSEDPAEYGTRCHLPHRIVLYSRILFP